MQVGCTPVPASCTMTGKQMQRRLRIRDRCGNTYDRLVDWTNLLRQANSDICLQVRGRTVSYPAMALIRQNRNGGAVIMHRINATASNSQLYVPFPAIGSTASVPEHRCDKAVPERLIYHRRLGLASGCPDIISG